MALFRMDGQKLVALIDALLGFLISTFARIYCFLTGKQAPAPEAESTVSLGTKMKRRAIGIAATVVIVGSVGSLVLTECRFSRGPDKRQIFKLQLPLCDVLSRETARLIADKGDIVLVVLNAGEMGSLVAESQAQGFLESIAEHQNIKVLATEKLSTNSRPGQAPEVCMGLPSPLLFSILEKYPHASAIVSFIGSPILTEEEMDQIGEKAPKIAVVAHFQNGLKNLFDHKVVQLAIVPRSRAQPAPPAAAGSLDEKFNQEYELITTENAESLKF